MFAAPQDLPREVTSGQPDDALLRGLTRYLSSMSLTVRVLDQGFVQRIQELGEQMTQQPEDAATGRNKTTGQVVETLQTKHPQSTNISLDSGIRLKSSVSY